MPRKTAAKRTRKKPGQEPNHAAPDLIPPIDFYGHSFRVAESNDIAELGLTWYEAALIEIRTRHRGVGKKPGRRMNEASILDTILHEAFHAGLHGNGGAKRLRKRFKLSAAQWTALEEVLILEFTAAVAAPLVAAGILVFPQVARSPAASQALTR